MNRILASAMLTLLYLALLGAIAACGRGDDDSDQSTPPPGEFTSVSAGDDHTCGVMRDGAVACWGYDQYGQSTPPPGEFTSVSAGDNHTCGVKRDGAVACWGYDQYGESTPPTGEFNSVSGGFYHTCGVRRDGTIACWGRDVFGRATPPTGGVRLRQRRRRPHLWGDAGRRRRLLGPGIGRVRAGRSALCGISSRYGVDKGGH